MHSRDINENRMVEQVIKTHICTEEIRLTKGLYTMTAPHNLEQN